MMMGIAAFTPCVNSMRSAACAVENKNKNAKKYFEMERIKTPNQLRKMLRFFIMKTIPIIQYSYSLSGSTLKSIGENDQTDQTLSAQPAGTTAQSRFSLIDQVLHHHCFSLNLSIKSHSLARH